MRLHVGCAMWTYAPWQGRLIPHPLPPSERLRAYASWCNAVEGNTTFYATPAVATVESWAAQTAEDFRFVVKLPKTATHEQRLRGVDLRPFFTAMEPLGPRNHAFWIQLPASFAPADLGVIATFLYRLPRGYRYAVEVRHPSFFDDERSARQLEHVLGRVGAEWIPFDTVTLFRTPASSYAERDAWMKKPRVLRRTRALTATPIVRYIGRDDPQLTVAGWDYLVKAVVDWLAEGRSPTVFLHTPDNVDALTLARRFYSDVAAVVPELSPLPEPLPVAPPTLF
ncbi:uncharacterized protein YecE (DUF72 family) [Kribbella voronezhensis]|uniref:Uncharacterized protein YecE (DUF72 family) n=1 Tax=Kribbella voronezhensis TaxID=2512212 RepID=A0A4V3FKE5_9ACTN|nr:DUF72 domain-containing protein [Kribbella voronezhensis]TDU89933.1 uncharacterized protein YecE (DUF72 family) [Kribbella voronezhensis]